MYHDHFGLDEPPFKITPDTRLFYEGGRRGDILDALVYAITCGEGIVKVVGEVGSGKTMLSRMLEVRLSEQVDLVYLANPSIAPADIPFAIGVELGLNIDTETDRIRAVHLLQQELLARHAKGRQVVCFVEEAQSMPLETLEEIRLLSNLETHRAKLLQIVLFGQPELDTNLDEPSIRQLRERIVHSFNLDPLGALDVGSYISFRMRAVGYRGPDVFSKGALKLLSKASQGLIRRVNILGDKALLSAFAENSHQVTDKHVRIAIRDSEFGRIKSKPYWGRYGAMAAAVVAALASGVLLAKYLPQGDGTFVVPTAPSEVNFIEQSPNTSSSSPSVTVRPSNAQKAELLKSEQASGPQAALDLKDAAQAATELKATEGARSRGTKALDEIRMPVSDVTELSESVNPEETQDAASSHAAITALETVTQGPVLEVDISKAEVQSNTPLALEPTSGQQSVEADSATHNSARDIRTAGLEVPTSSTVGAKGVSMPPRAPKKPQRFLDQPAVEGAVSQESLKVRDSRPVQPRTEVVEVSRPMNSEMPLLTERLTATRNWLGGNGKALYSIQLMLTRPLQAGRLEKFLRRWQDDGELGRVYIYLTRIGEQEWYGVLYDQFDSLASAQAALKNLPDSLLRHGPYVRNIRDISSVG